MAVGTMAVEAAVVDAAVMDAAAAGVAVDADTAAVDVEAAVDVAEGGAHGVLVVDEGVRVMARVLAALVTLAALPISESCADARRPHRARCRPGVIHSLASNFSTLR